MRIFSKGEVTFGYVVLWLVVLWVWMTVEVRIGNTGNLNRENLILGCLIEDLVRFWIRNFTLDLSCINIYF